MHKMTSSDPVKNRRPGNTAFQAGRPKPPLPALDDDPGLLATSWPTSAQFVAAGLLVGVLAILAVDRLISHSSVEPTALVRVERIDVNRATRSQLLQVPGIGPRLADTIIEYRRRAGPIQTIDDLQKIDGIGFKSTARLKKWLRAERESNPTPAKSAPVAPKANQVDNRLINLNTASNADLQSLPRIGPKLADRIIAERAKRPFASVDDLTRVYGIGKKTVDNLRPFVTVR